MMHNPPHPGLTLRDDVLPAMNVGVVGAASQLGVTRQALSAVLNAHAAISAEMALRLEAWLGIEHGGRADLWLAQQAAFDLWQTRQRKKDELDVVIRYRPQPTSAGDGGSAVRKARGNTRRVTVGRVQPRATAARAGASAPARKKPVPKYG